jgi:PAS domain S-box-containing protein
VDDLSLSIETSSAPWPPGDGGMAAHIRAFDWSATPLGPSAAWPDRLRLAIEMVLASPMIASLACGPERLLIYNDAAARLYGERHPGALGRPLPETFPESYPAVSAFYDRAFAGDSIHLPAQPLDVRGVGDGAVFDAYLTPVRGADGQVLAVHMAGLEVGERVRREQAEAALREGEERYRALFETMDQGFCIIEKVATPRGKPSDFRYVTANPAFERHTGLRDVIGRTIRQLVPAPEASIMDRYDRVVRTGEPERFEGYVAQLDMWMEAEVFPTGVSGRIAVLFSNISTRKRAEAALRDSEERFRAVANLVPDMLWSAAPNGEGEWFSGRWTAFTGVAPERLTGLGWLDLLHPEDLERTRATIEATLDGRVDYEVEFRLRRADGRYRWFLTRATPYYGLSGELVQWLGVCTDIEEIRNAQEEQKLLLTELQHRVRNILAVVRSIARRTAANSETVEDYGAHLDGRLNALARTQAAVTRDPAAGVSLEQIVGEELLAFAAREGGPLRISGPEIRLKPKTAETLGLAVHELATNSVKYGALSDGHGRLSVTWTVQPRDGAPWLCFEWAETANAIEGGTPSRRGFGTELLERTLAYELKARTGLDFQPGAFTCTVEFSLNDRTVTA